MIHIHPFPARMAPEIALNKLLELKEGRTVLDPMSGSGMVLSLAARQNLTSIGIDLDPLARLISLTGATRVAEKKAILALEALLEMSRKSSTSKLLLPWIDDNLETQKFISYWFADKQSCQLRSLAYHLIAQPFIRNRKIVNILLVAISRLIITKEPKASLARDTAHSRPHRTIKENEFDVFDALPNSLDHVVKALNSNEIKIDTKAYLGDARNLRRIKDGEIDSIITSPPYLNAIDYMRGHKFSLVWFGYRISELRKIRGTTIGAEKSNCYRSSMQSKEVDRMLNSNELGPKNVGMLQRYFHDLCLQMQETNRVLKRGGTACYVIGNSAIRGNTIENNELLKRAAFGAGLKIISETTREIPNGRRYLPIMMHSENSLAKRMRTEHVISFLK